MSVCMYVSMYVCVCMFVCLYVWIDVYLCMRSTRTCVCVPVCSHMSVACTHICPVRL